MLSRIKCLGLETCLFSSLLVFPLLHALLFPAQVECSPMFGMLPLSSMVKTLVNNWFSTATFSMYVVETVPSSLSNSPTGTLTFIPLYVCMLIDDHPIGNLITTRCFVWFSQCCLQFSHCQCLCEATVIVGWMTAFFVLRVSLHSGIYSRVRLQCIAACKVFVELFCFLSAVCH